MKIKRIFSPIYGTTLSVLLLISICIKSFFIFNINKAEYQDTTWSTIFSELSPTFFSDIFVRIISLFLLLLSLTTKKKRIRIICITIIFLFVLLFAIDLLTLSYAGLRLSLPDLYVMITSGASGSGNIVFTLIGEWLGYSIIGLLIALIIQNIQKNSLLFSNIITLLLTTTFFFTLGITNDFQKTDLSNIFTVNIASFFYKNDILPQEEGPKNYLDYFQIEKGEGKRPNIIFLFGESLSATDSKKAGGEDSLPLFDQISNDGILLSRIIENGGTSDTAHISAFLGVEPYFKGTLSDFYTGYQVPTQPLAKYFSSIGYSTTFISSVTMTFLNQLDFIKMIGFEEIIGEESFKNKKKYVFEAAPDKDLYDKIIEEIEKKSQTSQPFFIGSQTISLHTPYDTPYGKTEEQALKYIDDSFSQFYQKLVDMDYFSSGILIVLGDHRKMRPITKKDKENLGDIASYLSLGLIIGTGIKQDVIMDTKIQPTDFFYSLKKYTATGDIYLKKNYNSIFGDKIGRDRTLTTMYYDEINKYHFITFSGDETKIITNKNFSLDNKDNDEKINYLSSYLTYQFGETHENQSGVMIIGHCGGGNLAQGNSIEGFYAAKKANLQGVEFDVSYTKDGKNVVAHGPTLRPSSCPKVNIYNKTLQWLKENCTLKNGESVTTLETMLDLIDGLFEYYFLELKADDKETEKDKVQQAIDAINIVKNRKMENKVIFISYDNKIRETLLADTGIILGRDTYDVIDFKDPKLINNQQIQYFMAPYDMMTEEVIQDIKNAHKKFVTYTINETGTLENFIDAGVDMVLSNEPILLKEFVKEKQKNQ